jgi:hypothetical protein
MKTTDANYYQVVSMSYEEKVAMYMKLKKRELVEMLIHCNELLDNLSRRRDNLYSGTPYDLNRARRKK